MAKDMAETYESILDELHDVMLPEAPSLTDNPQKRHPPSPELFELILWNLILAPLAGVLFAELWNRVKSRSSRGMIEEEDILEVRRQVETVEIKVIEENSTRITDETAEQLRGFGIGQSKSVQLARKITEIRLKHIRKSESS